MFDTCSIDGATPAHVSMHVSEFGHGSGAQIYWLLCEFNNQKFPSI